MTFFFSSSTCKKVNKTPSKTFLHRNIFAQHRQKTSKLHTNQDNQPLFFSQNDKTRLHTFQPSILQQDIIYAYDQLLQIFWMQVFHDFDPDYEKFYHQSSVADPFLSASGTLEETMFKVQNCFPRNDPKNFIQQDIHTLLMAFRAKQLRLLEIWIRQNGKTSHIFKWFSEVCFFSENYLKNFKVENHSLRIPLSFGCFPWNFWFCNNFLTSHLSYQYLVLQTYR